MDYSRFINQEAAYTFFCIICHGIAYRPRQHGKCGKIFCGHCALALIEAKLKCPTCYDTSTPPVLLKLSEMIELSEELENTYKNLEIKCIFCTTSFTLREYYDHIIECQNWPVELTTNTYTTNIVSEPKQDKMAINNFRLVQLFQNGKPIFNSHRKEVKVKPWSNASNLYATAARLVGSKENQIALVHSTHKVIEKFDSLNILENDYCSINIVSRKVGDLINKRRMYLKGNSPLVALPPAASIRRPTLDIIREGDEREDAINDTFIL